MDVRLHLELDDDLARRVDQVSGPRHRSAYVRAAIVRALGADERAESLLAVAGSLRDTRHEWDADPAAWVREQRRDEV
ncbi:hypothetical protein [Knoellia koreensis]|uniref:Ribbon-helix-helix protein, CopG family n=1 Tax=Knoellia koreensis TaxID=2730921 RepID=A0A849HJU2_9MICO|nr:hypothetical protein [Knoellia sp. DB2414S]NNM47562.1 hypothetical protein [Knoellia sp. DB2414S]